MKKLKQTKFISESGKYDFFTKKEKKVTPAPFIAVGLVLVLLIVLTIAGLREGTKLTVTHVTVTHEQVPVSFDGFKILQISDIHGRDFGTNQSELKKLIEKEEYDIVIFTGDYLTSPTDEDYYVVKDIVDILKKGTPIYYVLGNNDYEPSNVTKTSDKWMMCIEPETKTAFQTFFEKECGAKFIYPLQKIESEQGEYIYLTGINYDKVTMNEADFDTDRDFSITVTHKPINYDVTKRLKDVNKRTITEVDYDLSISGHTCGNQYSLPILGTVFDSDEGWFPQEDNIKGLSKDSAGRYNYICGGLGVESGVRFFSRPEVSIIELKCAIDSE